MDVLPDIANDSRLLSSSAFLVTSASLRVTVVVSGRHTCSEVVVSMSDLRGIYAHVTYFSELAAMLTGVATLPVAG